MKRPVSKTPTITTLDQRSLRRAIGGCNHSEEMFLESLRGGGYSVGGNEGASFDPSPVKF